MTVSRTPQTLARSVPKSNLRILCLGTYPVESAAARYRVLQYFPHLRAHGIEPQFSSFFDSAFFRRFYEPRHKARKALRLMGYALRRLELLRRAAQYDVVLVHREAALIGPPLIEKQMAGRLGKPLVFDFDDAIHISYVSPVYGRVASLVKYPQKTPQTIALSRAVIAGNRHLEEYARGYNANVTVIPTVLDANIVQPVKKSGGSLVLGWMGTHSTLPYLETLFPVLQNLARRHDFVLRVVGGGREVQIEGVTVDNRPWRMESETSDLQGFDIGLYPILEDEWSLGKSGFKAIQYMTVGIPAVCSPVGATCDIITPDEQGFLPRNGDEWETALTRLLSDADLRRQMGAAGRERAESWYCLDQQAPRLRAVLENAAT